MSGTRWLGITEETKKHASRLERDYCHCRSRLHVCFEFLFNLSSEETGQRLKNRPEKPPTHLLLVEIISPQSNLVLRDLDFKGTHTFDLDRLALNVERSDQTSPTILDPYSSQSTHMNPHDIQSFAQNDFDASVLQFAIRVLDLRHTQYLHLKVRDALVFPHLFKPILKLLRSKMRFLVARALVPFKGRVQMELKPREVGGRPGRRQERSYKQTRVLWQRSIGHYSIIRWF